MSTPIYRTRRFPHKPRNYGAGVERIPASGLPHDWSSFEAFGEMNNPAGKTRRFADGVVRQHGSPVPVTPNEPTSQPAFVSPTLPNAGLAAEAIVRKWRFAAPRPRIDSGLFNAPIKTPAGYTSLVDSASGPRMVGTVPSASVIERDHFGTEFAALTPAQKGEVYRSQPHLRPDAPEIGRDRYDANGNKIIATVPGAPVGTIAEYDPRRDTNRNRWTMTPAEREALRLYNVDKGMRLNPEYVRPGETGVGTATFSPEDNARNKAVQERHAAWLQSRQPGDLPPVPGLRFGTPDFGRAARDAALAARGLINGANAAIGTTSAANVGGAVGGAIRGAIRKFGEMPRTPAGIDAAMANAELEASRANLDKTIGERNAEATAKEEQRRQTQVANEARERAKRLRDQEEALRRQSTVPTPINYGWNPKLVPQGF